MRDRYNLGAGGDDAIASKTGSAANTSQAEVTNIPGREPFFFVCI